MTASTVEVDTRDSAARASAPHRQARDDIHRITVDQLLRWCEYDPELAEARIELIEGRIIDMAPPGPPHDGSITELIDLFAPVIGRLRVTIQTGLRLDDESLLLPDLMLLKPRGGHYRTHHPVPADVELAIEVAHSSIHRDAGDKLRLYATSGIADYWIVDLRRKVLIVHREPDGGQYDQVQTLRGDQTIAPLAMSELALRAGDLTG
jgi:Uma2 family endonuclease